ncbi:MAG: hypothetical protein ACO20H_10820 [Bacteriovoracaceae bacterium]
MGENTPTDNELIEELTVTKIEETSGDTLVELNSNSQTLGPYKLEELLQIIDKKGVKESNLEIKSTNENLWHPLFKHPFIMNREAPKLVSTQEFTSNDTFLILSEGKRLGPLPKEEILEKLRTKEILYTDYISFDHGFTWSHIYNIEEFYSEQKRDEEDLPPPPDKKSFSKTIKPSDKSEFDTFISLLNTGKGQGQDGQESVTQADDPFLADKKSNKQFYTFILIVIGFALLFYFTKSLLTEKSTKAKSRTTKQRSVKKPFIKVDSKSKKYGETPSRFDSKEINKAKNNATRFEKAQAIERNKDINDRDTEDLVDPYDEIVKESEREAREQESLEDDNEDEKTKANKEDASEVKEVKEEEEEIE